MEALPCTSVRGVDVPIRVRVVHERPDQTDTHETSLIVT
jgi:hypothetical protein